MSEQPIRDHGLGQILAGSLPQHSGVTAPDSQIRITLLAELGVINLRGDSEHPEFLSAVKSATGQALPTSFNTMTIGEHNHYWLGPDEWMIVTPYPNTAPLLEQLHVAVNMQHAAVTDVSGGNIVYRLAGRNVRDVLAKGCTLDFHPASFSVGKCAGSGLAKAVVLIGHVGDGPVYELVVRRSFSEYVTRWLQQASREYGANFAVI